MVSAAAADPTITTPAAIPSAAKTRHLLPPAIRPARLEDADAIAATLRRFGAEEARGLDLSADAIRSALSISAAAWVWFDDDGEIVCLFGIEAPSLIGERAGLWWLTTPLVARQTFRFLRGSRQVLVALTKQYPVLEGSVEATDRASIRWLRRFGFRVYSNEPLPMAGVFRPVRSTHYFFQLQGRT